VAKHWGLVDAAVRPPAIRCLPAHVPEDELPIPPAGPAAEEDGPQPLALPIGIDGETLHPAYLELHLGDHLLVAGPARSGRSHTLALLARMAVRADGAAAVVALAPRTAGRHPLRPFTPCSTVAELADAIAAVPAGRRLLVVVDDAELVDDVEGVLARLLTGDANVLAAGRTDAIRSGYGHWTQELRRRRRGLLLAPESDLDGDLFGITLPRWPLAPGATGRGYLVMDGRGTLVQVAVPSSHPWDGGE
jgi:S-DNA-T family DNA segregation ATPase FtsK/SpoIIIE